MCACSLSLIVGTCVKSEKTTRRTRVPVPSNIPYE